MDFKAAKYGWLCELSDHVLRANYKMEQFK